MGLPTPDDPGRSPVWENYLVAQTVQAALGQLPRNALAVGVEVVGTDVHVRFQLADLDDDDAVDMDYIFSELQALVGEKVHVRKSSEVRKDPAISPGGHVRWIFLARR